MIGLWASGCTSVSMMYNYGNFMARWEIDNYFNTNSKQDDFLKSRIASQLNWHKAQELPHYIALLEKVERVGTKPLSHEELEQLFAQFEARRNQLITHLIPDVAEFLASLTPKQVANLREALETNNQERLEKINRPLAVRLEEEIIDREEDFTEWFGFLTKEQQQLISDWNQQRFLQKEAPDQRRWQRRQKNQKAFLAFMETAPNVQQIENWLEKWMATWTESQSLTPLQEQKAPQQQVTSLILQFDALLTKEQRQFALKRIRDYKEQIQDVIPHFATSSSNSRNSG